MIQTDDSIVHRMPDQTPDQEKPREGPWYQEALEYLAIGLACAIFLCGLGTCVRISQTDGKTPLIHIETKESK